jgi:hypothetical protein
MKFICLGYGEEKSWDAMPKSKQDAVIEECFQYDESLLASGLLCEGGQALQSTQAAKTIRWRDGKIVVTDGPFAETKEQLGALGVLEARDIDHAIEIMSDHPSLRYGIWTEIRPVDEEKLKRQMASSAKYRSEAGVAANAKAKAMKFASLGYVDPTTFEGQSPCDFDAMIERCIAFDELRRKNGQWLAGIALQGVHTAKTLRVKGGNVVATDGPFAETKEQLGGVVVLALRDMSQAVELLSTHPALKFGVTIEIRPIDDAVNLRWEARQYRFKKDIASRGKMTVA